MRSQISRHFKCLKNVDFIEEKESNGCFWLQLQLITAYWKPPSSTNTCVKKNVFMVMEQVPHNLQWSGRIGEPGWGSIYSLLFKSLAPGRSGSNFKSIIFKLNSLGSHCEIALWIMPWNLSNEKLTLVQVMAWCHQAMLTQFYMGICHH